MSTPLEDVQKMIAALPHDSQVRIAVTADILRELLAADAENENEEVMLAFTLVMAEISE